MTERDKQIEELKKENDLLRNKLSVLNYMLSRCITEFNGLLKATSEHSKAFQEVLNGIKSPDSAKK